MSKELQEQLAQMLASLLDTANGATTWTKGQLPLLIAEKVKFGIVENSLNAILFLLVLAVALLVARAGWKRLAESDDVGIPMLVFGSIASVLAGREVFMALRGAMLAYYAPRLYIVEWLTTLAKS